LYWNFRPEQIGRPYDTLAIAAFALDRDWRSPDAFFAMSWGPPASNILVWCTSLHRASIGSVCAAVLEANACLVRLTVRLHAGSHDVTLSELRDAEFDGVDDLGGVEHMCYGPDDLLER
jgi:hypothetical protein